MKYFTDKEIEDAFNRAPQVIKDELVSGEDTAIVLASIGSKFNLNINVNGIVAELNRNMFLGLITPQEFLQELVAARVPEADAQQILAEITQKIFVPLRNKMQSGGVGVSKPVTPPAPAASQPQANAPVPNYAPPRPPAYTAIPQATVIIPANPAMPARPPQQQSYITKVSSHTPPHPAAPRPQVAQVPVRPPVPVQQKPVSANSMLENHEEQHIEVRQSVSQITPPPRPPAYSNVGAPPPNLPGMMPPPPRPTPPAPPPVPLTPRPPLDSYSADPYREPFDEK